METTFKAYRVGLTVEELPGVGLEILGKDGQAVREFLSFPSSKVTSGNIAASGVAFLCSLGLEPNFESPIRLGAARKTKILGYVRSLQAICKACGSDPLVRIFWETV